jgi:hypothetical protein
MLAASMPRLKAVRLKEQYDTGQVNLDPVTLFETIMEATGNEPLASAYSNARIRADWKPMR